MLYEEFGDDLFTNFDKVSTALEIRLVEWSSDDDGADDEEDPRRGETTRRGDYPSRG